MNQVRLAIVIPAYKPDFLDETLASLASQGNKDFMEAMIVVHIIYTILFVNTNHLYKLSTTDLTRI